MEWVETTGTTIEAAKEAALDELGVDEQDAEFEVLEEPKTGLFGRLRSEGRVRARVRPTAPRPKDDRRDRRKTKSKEAGASEGEPTAAEPTPGVVDQQDQPRQSARRSGSRPPEPAASSTASPDDLIRRSATPAAGDGGAGEPTPSPRRRGGRDGRAPASEENGMEDVPMTTQAPVAEEFIKGLLSRFGRDGAEVVVEYGEAEVVDLDIRGDDLGLLIGPKGSTLLAIQDLTRTVVQRRTNGGNGRINIDVGGYRHKRSAALAKFALQVATEVASSGERRALEAMTSADRKVVHDALTDVQSVETVSEGEDPNRRVVISPAH